MPKHIEDITGKNYRLISLLNVDAKILKILESSKTIYKKVNASLSNGVYLQNARLF